MGHGACHAQWSRVEEIVSPSIPSLPRVCVWDNILTLTRSPMGRESVLFPITWKKSQWPIASQVRGEMNGWSLPRGNQALPGAGPFAGDDDVVDFESGSSIPQNFLYWRFPADGAFQVAPKGHPNALRVRPSRANLSGPVNSTEKALTGKLGLSFIGRKQAHTFFSYTCRSSVHPKQLRPGSRCHCILDSAEPHQSWLG